MIDKKRLIEDDCCGPPIFGATGGCTCICIGIDMIPIPFYSISMFSHI